MGRRIPSIWRLRLKNLFLCWLFVTTYSTAAVAVVAAETKSPEKKNRYLTDKKQAGSIETDKWHKELNRRMTAPASRIVNIYNTWTHESFAVNPKNPEEVTKAQANKFFRCHFTHQETNLDPKLVTAIIAAAKHFQANQIEIVSGFRAPKYNLMLIKKGRQVARNSQHTLGNAIDFRIPGVPIRLLHQWARKQRLGGVGVYHGSGFIHIDVGPIRYWGGR